MASQPIYAGDTAANLKNAQDKLISAAKLLESSMTKKASSKELRKMYQTIALLESDMEQELGVPKVGLEDMIQFFGKMVGELPIFKVRIGIKRPETPERFTVPKSDVMALVAIEPEEPIKENTDDKKAAEEEIVADVSGTVIKTERIE